MSKNTLPFENYYSCYDLEDLEAHWSYMLDPKYDFSGHSTLELLGILRSQAGREVPGLREVLKKVLATRPNIPTKAQARAARQEKAKAQRNR